MAATVETVPKAGGGAAKNLWVNEEAAGEKALMSSENNDKLGQM